MRRDALIGLLLPFALMCSPNALASSPDDEGAREAALQWLQVVDSGKFEDATLQMSQEVRPLRDWPNYFAAHRAPLGRANKRQVAEIKRASTIPGVPGARNYKIIRFKTSFEHQPAATEEITMVKMGCCWEVAGYKIGGR